MKRKERRFLNHIDLRPYLQISSYLNQIIEQLQTDYQNDHAIANLNEHNFYKYLTKRYPRVFIVQQSDHYIIRHILKDSQNE